jgi:hypothetical protein
MKPIEELTKSELLSLIYNNLGKTKFFVHPCECASCGQAPVEEGGYYYICDYCNGIEEFNEFETENPPKKTDADKLFTKLRNKKPFP